MPVTVHRDPVVEFPARQRDPVTDIEPRVVPGSSNRGSPDVDESDEIRPGPPRVPKYLTTKSIPAALSLWALVAFRTVMQSTPFAPGRAAWTITPRPRSLRARRGSVSRARRRPRCPSWARRLRRQCSRPESEDARDRASELLHGGDHV